MSDQSEISANAMGQSSSTPPEHAVRHGSMILSMIGLIAGMIALALAVVPAIAFERPLPNPFADKKNDDRRIDPPAEREGGITLKFKGMSMNIGGKVPKKEVPAEKPPEVTKDPIRWLTISAIGCALIGLVAATVGHLRERHTILTVTSMGCCAAAITWQYVAIGIVVGVALAVLVIVLRNLDNALN